MFCVSADSTELSGEVKGSVWEGLKAAFNAEGAEYTEREKRGLSGFHDDHTGC